MRSEYLSPEDAAAELGIHVQTVRTYVRSGKLPAMRLAGERAIRIQEDCTNCWNRFSRKFEREASGNYLLLGC